MLVASTDDITARYLASFRQRQAYGRARHEPGWLLEQRRQAIERFAQYGFPTTKDEEWRSTNLAPLTSRELSLPRLGGAVSDAELEPLLVPGLEGCRLVFVDGRFAPALSQLASVPNAVTVCSLAEVIADAPEKVRPWLESDGLEQQDAFDRLNDAFLGDGAYVHIPREAVVEGVIQLVHVTTPAGTLAMTHPRSLIVAEPASHACVLEQHVCLTQGAFFTNAHTRLAVADGAFLGHYLLQQTSEQAVHVSMVKARLTRDARLESHAAILGGALVRNNIHAVLDGPGADCLLNGLYLGHGRRHLDNHMRVEHAQPHGSSRQYYQGVLADQSRGVFCGRIIVRPDAQKTDAKQTNRNLLLSPDAEADSKPQLEIYADDVKCTHGATIGQLSEEALFYLRARGIDEVSARGMLVRAFAAEGLERMALEPVREFLQTVLDHRLRQDIKREERQCH